jgi:arsenate reductase
MEGMRMGKKRVLVLCTGNSARSQMGVGLFRVEGGADVDVFSAGTKPGSVRPEAITVMKEIGIDISGHRSKSVDEFAGQSFDYVVTVCDNALDNCPVFPAGTEESTGASRIRPRRRAVKESGCLLFAAFGIKFTSA